MSGLDRVKGEDTADGDDVERKNNDEGVRELHVRLLFGLVVVIVVSPRVGGAFRAERFRGGGRRGIRRRGSFRIFFIFMMCGLVGTRWLFESVYGILEAVAALAVVAEHVEGRRSG